MGGRGVKSGRALGRFVTEAATIKCSHGLQQEQQPEPGAPTHAVRAVRAAEVQVDEAGAGEVAIT
jgi:hypothetical protein